MNPLNWSALFTLSGAIGIITEAESNLIYTCFILSNIWAATYYVTKDKS